jgi:hypothetical protein
VSEQHHTIQLSRYQEVSNDHVHPPLVINVIIIIRRKRLLFLDAASGRHCCHSLPKSRRNININKQSSNNIGQLRLSNMKLHGREDDIKLLRGKLRKLAKKNEEYAAENNVGEMMKRSTRLRDDASLCKPNPNKNADNESKNNNNNSLILVSVSGTSGTGKSALIQRGLGDHASKLGYTFTSG